MAVALEPRERRAATELALSALGPSDLSVVEQTIIARCRDGHDSVSRALLRHPIEDVRGTASLWFGLASGDDAATLPGDWYSDWAEAFAVAPMQSIRGNNYRLGEQIVGLIPRDPDLVERWLIRQLKLVPHASLYRLPDQAQTGLWHLPAPHRDRLMRAANGHPSESDLLGCLLGEDMAWLGQLLDDDVVDVDDVLVGLNHNEREVPDRIPRILALAPVLVARGIEPGRLAVTAELGSWRGDESANFEAIRGAFANAPSSADPPTEAVRLAGIRIFERARDKALGEERERRVAGDL